MRRLWIQRRAPHARHYCIYQMYTRLQMQIYDNDACLRLRIECGHSDINIAFGLINEFECKHKSHDTLASRRTPNIFGIIHTVRVSTHTIHVMRLCWGYALRIHISSRVLENPPTVSTTTQASSSPRFSTRGSTTTQCCRSQHQQRTKPILCALSSLRALGRMLLAQ